ncbi:MAG: hypothetical protein ACK53Y_07340, partial [bacterium]
STTGLVKSLTISLVTVIPKVPNELGGAGNLASPAKLSLPDRHPWVAGVAVALLLGAVARSCAIWVRKYC